MTFFNCLDPFHPEYPTLEISINLRNIEANLSLQSAAALLRIQGALLKKWENKDFKLVTEELLKGTQINFKDEVGILF